MSNRSHAKVSTYNNGCRCYPCEDAARTYRQLYQRPPARLPDGVSHGTVQAYRDHGCRCDPCRATKATSRPRAAKLQQPEPGPGPLEPHRCADTPKNVFFDFATIDDAKAICATCASTAPCFQGAKERGELYGVWGGVNFSASPYRRRRSPTQTTTRKT